MAKLDHLSKLIDLTGSVYQTFSMGFLGLRKWPTPVARPMWPFFAAAGLTFYLVSKAQDAGVKSEEFANDPRNPYALQVSKEKGHH